MCYFRVTLSNPDDFGAPQTVAQSLANDIINPAGPTMCTTNPAEPFCFGEEGITEACAKHPAQFVHYCTVPRPPNPIRSPLVWVQEAEKCDPAFRPSPEAKQALLDLVTPLAPGLVVTLYDFTCQNQQGGAFYQSTYQIAAGASLDVFTGSARIVDFLNKQRTTLCTAADPSARPVFCQGPPKDPLGGNNICAFDQFDPNAVLICPAAPGNLAVSFALEACNCASSPRNSPSDLANILEWITDITKTQAKVNVDNSLPEYRCVQAGTTCQYQYRARSAPRDDNTDADVAVQFIAAEVNANARPCSDVSGFSYAFCVPGAYWEKAKACSGGWDRDAPLSCELP
jgi:hypothetical protein